jgi:hypothetical protein
MPRTPGSRWPSRLAWAAHYAETSYAVRLLHFAAGSVGYLVKDRVQEPAGLIDAVERVARGEVVIDPEIVRRPGAAPAGPHAVSCVAAPNDQTPAVDFARRTRPSLIWRLDTNGSQL